MLLQEDKLSLGLSISGSFFNLDRDTEYTLPLSNMETGIS